MFSFILYQSSTNEYWAAYSLFEALFRWKTLPWIRFFFNLIVWSLLLFAKNLGLIKLKVRPAIDSSFFYNYLLLLTNQYDRLSIFFLFSISLNICMLLKHLLKDMLHQISWPKHRMESKVPNHHLPSYLKKLY